MDTRIFFLFAFLTIGFLPTVFAETEKGINYDKELLGIDPDGTAHYLWQSHPERIHDGTSYQNYIFTDTANSLMVETMGASVTLDKSTCGFSFHNKGFIAENPVPIFTDSITPYSKITGTSNWSEVTQVSNAACQTSWDGHELVATKQNAVGKIQYKYILIDNKWKTQLETTNLTGLTDHIFGFDQTINLNRDTIYFGSQKNLDNYDTHTFDRTFLENQESKVIHLLTGNFYDFTKDFEYLDSVSIFDTGIDSSQLVFHYMRNDEILLPNETLIIDPSFSGGTTSDRVVRDSDNSDTCDQGDLIVNSATELFLTYLYPTSSSNDCYRGYVEFDISSLPITLTPSNTNMTLGVTANGGVATHTWDVYSMTTQGSTIASAADMFDDIATGTQVVTAGATELRNTGDQEIDLTSVGNTNIETLRAASQDWVSYGFKFTDETLDPAITRYIDVSPSEEAGTDPTLTIEYTILPAPDAVDDLSSPAQTYGSVDLLWTQPTLNGGNLTGYQINYTTPWGNPTTIITNNTETSDTSATVSGLEIATDYTFGVSAWTEAGNNATKPPMTWLNVTTQGNFTIGTASFNQTNTQTLPITFEEQSINSTAKFLNVTFANTYVMACDFSYKFANTNQTYTGLTSYAVSSTLDETSFVFTNSSNEIINVLCWDTVTGDEARYLMSQSDFPLLQQIADFRAGEFGTAGNFGVYDFVTLLVVIISMIGLNRVNPSVGIVFNIALLGSLAYFGIVELPTIIFGAIAVLMVFVITSTRKSA